MKFTVAVSALLAVSGVSAFAPANTVAGARSSSLSQSTVATEPTYTFTKSEEIFAEAQEVRGRIVSCIVSKGRNNGMTEGSDKGGFDRMDQRRKP